MAWSGHSRVGYEAAIVRARRDLMKAQDHADASGDEGVVEDLTSVCLTLTALLRDSQDGRRPRSGRVEQIPGQLKADVG